MTTGAGVGVGGRGATSHLLPVAHGGAEGAGVVPETPDTWHVVPLAQSAFDAQLWALANAGAPSTMATAEAKPKRIFVVDMGLRSWKAWFVLRSSIPPSIPRATPLGMDAS